MVVGGDRGDLGVRHRDLRIVGRQLQVLLVLSGAVVAMGQGEDQRIAALKLAELTDRAGVVRESVIGEIPPGLMSGRIVLTVVREAIPSRP
jgi:hypothetical protein